MMILWIHLLYHAVSRIHKFVKDGLHHLLTSTEKQDLAKLHNNLGRPDPTVLAEHLKV